MPPQVYLLGHDEANKFSTDTHGNNHIKFSDIGKILELEGFQLGDLTIEHALVDAKVPFREFEDSFYEPVSQTPESRREEIIAKKISGPARHLRGDDYGDALGVFGKGGYRYRTIILYGNVTQGSVLGYSKNVRNDRIGKMIGVYVKDSERYKPPFFVITNPESVPEVKEVFNQLGLETKLIEASTK